MTPIMRNSHLCIGYMHWAAVVYATGRRLCTPKQLGSHLLQQCVSTEAKRLEYYCWTGDGRYIWTIHILIRFEGIILNPFKQGFELNLWVLN